MRQLVLQILSVFFIERNDTFVWITSSGNDNFVIRSLAECYKGQKILLKRKGCLTDISWNFYGKYFPFKYHIGGRQFENLNDIYLLTQPTYYVNPKLS